MAGDTIIRIEKLGKRYRLGPARHDTLRDRLTHAWRKPLSRWRGDATPDDSEFWALQDVSFEVKRGEVLGIIGRNGAGKSTLLKILSRITEPTTGRVTVHGRVASLLEVGTGFHPELSGRENVFLNGAILGMSRAEIRRKFDEIVAFAEVERFLDTAVKHYSSGMYVRLAFAVAAHLEPEILIIDEVLAVGDVAFQRKCLGKMDAVARGGRTVLFVSHNMAVVQTLCQSTILLQGGRLLSHGPVEHGVSEYLKGGVEATGQRLLETLPQGTDSELRFIRVSSLDPKGTPTSHVKLSDGIRLEIEYDLVQAIRGAQVGFELWNELGTCVLCSSDFDIEPDRFFAEKPAGRYRVSCHVPPEFLRAGTYHITLASSIPNVRPLAELENALRFHVVDDGSIVAKLSQGRRGVVLPILPWKAQAR